MKYPVFFKVVGVVDMPEDDELGPAASAEIRAALRERIEEQLCRLGKAEVRTNVHPGAQVTSKCSVLFVLPCTKEELFGK